MFQSLVEKSLQNIEVISSLIDELDLISDRKANPEDRRSIKFYSQASSLSRLYAVYENFVEKILSDYLDFVSDIYSFKSMTDSFKNEYRMGISHILSRIDQGRYNHLQHDDVVNRYHNAINNNSPYQFVTDALIRHEQNFRFNILENLLSRLGLEGFDSWVSNHRIFEEHYESKTKKELIESSLKEFVQLRNDASHSEMDTLLSPEQLKGYCNFISSLINVVQEFVLKNVLKHKIENNSAYLIGKVSEVFKNDAFVYRALKNKQISKGGEIVVMSDYYCYVTLVESIQLNGQVLDSITPQEEHLEVGLKCNLPVKKNANILILE